MNYKPMNLEREDTKSQLVVRCALDSYETMNASNYLSFEAFCSDSSVLVFMFGQLIQ